MSYKYDRERGFRNADQIGADAEDYNEVLYKLVTTMKKTKDVRAAINMARAFLEGMKDYQNYIQEQDTKNVETTEEQALNNRQQIKDIKKTTNIEENKSEIEQDDGLGIA